MTRTRLGGASGRYHDNCGALMAEIELAPGKSTEISFLLGQTATLEECRELVARYRLKGAVDRAARCRARRLGHDCCRWSRSTRRTIDST